MIWNSTLKRKQMQEIQGNNSIAPMMLLEGAECTIELSISVNTMTHETMQKPMEIAETTEYNFIIIFFFCFLWTFGSLLYTLIFPLFGFTF